MFGFNRKYFLAFVILFLIEVAIAVYVNDSFTRPYLGDVLVVIMLYCFVRAFLKIKATTAAIGVLLFAFLIELLQFLRVVEVLGLQENKLASTVLGSQFDWKDMLAYIVGVGVVLVVERLRRRGLPRSRPHRF